MEQDFYKDEKAPERRKKTSGKKLIHPALLALIDILLAGLLIVLFAYIDHGRAYLRGESSFNKEDVQNIGTDSVKLTFSAPLKNVGEKMTVSLSASGVEELSSLTVHLVYDKDLLEVDRNFLPGDILTNKDLSEFSEQTDSGGASVIVFKASAKGNNPLFKQDLGNLFNITFKVKGDLSGKEAVKVVVPEKGLLKKDGSTATVKLENTNDPNAEKHKFADKFTSGAVEETDTSYKSANVNVSWKRYEETIGKKKVVYYVADIYLRSPDLLKTAVADGNAQRVEVMAKNKNAIIAVNGDYFGARKQGVVVRNGKLIRKEPPFRDVLVMYEDGTMETYTKEQFNFDKAKERGIMHAWSFGPMLLENGKAMTEFNSDVNRANPRTAIGYYEPGHYCFLSVNGRGEEGSEGIRMEEMSALFEKLGCQKAYNLDGGQTSVMAWNLGSKIVNTPYKGGRSCSDMIYIVKN